MRPLREERPQVGQQEPALAAELLDRMVGVGEVEHRHLLDAEGGVVRPGFAAQVHHDALAVERPLRARQFAGGHGAVVDDVNLGSGFLHHPSGEGEGVAGGQDDVAALETHAAGADHVVERAGLGARVVPAMGGDDVLVVRSAVERQVAAGGHFAGGVVVGGLVAAQHQIAEIDLHLPAELVNVARFLLLTGLDDDCFATTRRRGGGGLRRRKQLASNYGRRQNQMTNKCSRDT